MGKAKKHFKDCWAVKVTCDDGREWLAYGDPFVTLKAKWRDAMIYAKALRSHLGKGTKTKPVRVRVEVREL